MLQSQSEKIKPIRERELERGREAQSAFYAIAAHTLLYGVVFRRPFSTRPCGGVVFLLLIYNFFCIFAKDMSGQNLDDSDLENDDERAGPSAEREYDDEDEDEEPPTDNWDLWTKIHSNRDVRLKLLCR